MHAPNAWYGPGNRVASFKNYQFSHDDDGNIIQKYNTSTGENKQFEWSAEGHLTRVLMDGVERVRYDYSASGQLVRRSTNGMIDRHFLWDQGHLLAEPDGSATQRIGEYAYVPGSADHPLALVTGAQAGPAPSRMTTSATAPPPCLRRSMSRRDTSTMPVCRAIGGMNFSAS